MLNRKLARELYQSKGLLLAITSIVAIGMTCFISMRSAYHNLRQAKTRYYRQCRMADFWIDLKKAPLVEIAALEAIPGITQLTPRIQFAATVDLEHVSKPLNSLVISLPDRRQPVVNDIVLKRGDYFTHQRRNEVIVNAAFARHHNIHPGSWIHLLLNNRRQELFVVGTAISSEFTYLLGPGALIPDPSSFGVFYIKKSHAEEVFDFNGAANQIVGRVAPQQHHRLETILDTAEQQLDAYGVFGTTPRRLQISNQFLEGEIAGLGATAAIVPAIFLVVAGLVLNVLITRLARQQRTVIGTLKALGYTDWHVFTHFLKFGLGVGIAGGALGSVLGYLSATGMTVMYRQFFEFPELQSGVYWYTHAVGMVVSLLCAILGSLRGARAMLRLQPAAAMRPELPRGGNKIWIEQFGHWWSSLSSAWRMTLRGVSRHPLRTLAGMFAAAMGAGLLLTGFMFMEIQNYLIDFQFHAINRSDIDLAFESERSEAALDEVKRLPGVDHAEPALNVACTFLRGPYRRKAGITGLLENARLTTPRDAQGQIIAIAESGIVLTDRLADILHADAGDTLTIIPVKGERRPVEVPVTAVAESYIGLAAYADIHYLSQLVNEHFTMTGAQLQTNHGKSDQLELYHELKQIPAIQSVTARQDMIDNLVDTLVKNQYVFIVMFVLFSGVVFFGSIVNSSLVSLAERQREVATFRAMGYGPWWVGGLFLRENLLVNTLGALLGLPFGYFLVQLTSLAYEQNDVIRLPVVSSPWVWIGTMALAFAFTLCAHAVVQWRVHHMDYLEALNVKE
ncbi:MAG: ABC transporter permease [Planctomycetota bacterium]